MRRLLVVSLCLLAILGCGEQWPHSREYVTETFISTLEDNLSPSFQQGDEHKLFNLWTTLSPFWRVEHLSGSIYRVSTRDVRCEPEISKNCNFEKWRFGMEPRLAMPEDGAALMTAIVFTCEGRTDTSARCREYFSTLDRMLAEDKGS